MADTVSGNSESVSQNLSRGSLSAIIFFALVVVYLLACILAFLALSLVVPVDQKDLADASWLVTPPAFGAIGFWACTSFGVFALLHVFIQNLGHAILLGTIAACCALATSESAALRLGVLQGDARIGCYTYESLECRKMLKLPIEDARSIYIADRNDASVGHQFADWYAEQRVAFNTKIRSSIPSTIPGVALLNAPWTLLKTDELKNLLDSQRAELNSVRQTDTP